MRYTASRSARPERCTASPSVRVANIKSLLLEHTGEALETQYRTEIEGRKGRFKGLSVEDGFKDFLDRKGRKPQAS